MLARCHGSLSTCLCEENANKHVHKTLAKQAVVARIVGHDGVGSVASSFDSKTLALKTLPTTLRPLCNCWAMDCIEKDKKAAIDKEVEAFAFTSVSSCDNNATVEVTDVD